MTAFIPKPIDTRGITLAAPVMQLSERLAENAHDVWARQKLEEEWVYGPALDETAKTTPLLVSYSALPESAKEYDRAVVLETLKSICALGFQIKEPQSES